VESLRWELKHGLDNPLNDPPHVQMWLVWGLNDGDTPHNTTTRLITLKEGCTSPRYMKAQLWDVLTIWEMSFMMNKCFIFANYNASTYSRFVGFVSRSLRS
jgi:hypothetical protein